ncbi:MAG: hypothetical protein C0518_07070 [Opitutus sp.]|nr:hypothetical protein [Opitutus sp.]
MKLRHLNLLSLVSLACCVHGSPLSGTWQLDPARSTEFSPWRELILTIVVDGDRVDLRRHFSNGRRSFTEDTALDLTLPVNVVPVTWWPDNRHLGAYIGGDKQKRIRAAWLDEGRVLRLSADLTLATSQGERAINILSDYKVSANGSILTLTELRSTRNQPVVYTFTRRENSAR